MTKRAVVIFPKCEDIKPINDMRKQYDPLAMFIPPHITLVFPFENDDTNEEIDQKLQRSLGVQSPFKVELCGISKNVDAYGNYLFLNVIQGNQAIEALHKALYKGFFSEDKSVPNYIPHITVGKLPSVCELEAAYEACVCSDAFLFTVDTVSVVKIKERENRITEIEQEVMYPLA